MTTKTFYAEEVPPPKEVIRARIRELLRERAISQAELAAGVGLDRTFVNKVYQGHRALADIADIARVARFLGVSVGYLLGETERHLTPQTASLIGVFGELEDAEDRRAVMDFAETLLRRQRRQAAGGAGAPTGDPPSESVHTPPTGKTPRRKKR